MSLPTHGRVVIETTAGDIEIELWSKEAPKACRNFLALAMEGYYDGVIFHRVVPDFLIQTGDRTGTGGGGESFYGEPFDDEIHPRLKFAHRGLVGCANNGKKNSNDSQFFITLDRADELNGKHTLWGRCVGDTFFNALKIGQTELGPDERPVYPPKIKTIRILDNPFDDIIPRITAAEKRAQQKAREAAQREREEEQRRKGAKKNVGLLSFGTESGTADDEEPITFKKKPIARPDLLDDTSMVAGTAAVPEPPKPAKSKKSKPVNPPTDSPAPSSSEGPSLVGMRAQLEAGRQAASAQQKQQIANLESSIRKMSRRDDSPSAEERNAKKAKGPSALEQELAKYSKNKGKKSGKRKDESDLLATLSNFRSKLQEASTAMDVDEAEKGDGMEDIEQEVDVDDDRDWLTHKLHFPKDNTEINEQAIDHYEVIDPRARSRQIREERKERREDRPGRSQAFRPGGRR